MHLAPARLVQGVAEKRRVLARLSTKPDAPQGFHGHAADSGIIVLEHRCQLGIAVPRTDQAKGKDRRLASLGVCGLGHPEKCALVVVAGDLAGEIIDFPAVAPGPVLSRLKSRWGPEPDEVTQDLGDRTASLSHVGTSMDGLVES